MEQQSPRPRALVTGASSGIGRAFAGRLAADGYDLVVVARRRERLEELAGVLRPGGVRVDVVAADLTRREDLREVEARAGDIDLLVHGAGFGGYMPFVQLDPDLAENLIGLQLVAATRLARAALPGMISRRSGAIVLVSSMLAFSESIPSPPLPPRATYVATKAFLNAFAELLSSELAGTGVQVQALCPAVVRTEFHQLMGMDPDRLLVPPMSADEVVSASLAGLALGEVITLPAVEDGELVAAYQHARTRTFENGRPNRLAARYRS